MRTAIVLALLLLSSCGTASNSCTLIGCTDGLTLRLQPADERFASGSYELRTTTDATTSCTFEVSAGCDGGASCEVSGDCADSVFTAGEIAVTIAGSPDAVQVELLRDGATVLTQDIMPEYNELQPNGPGCEPTCRQAVKLVTVP